VRSGHYRNAMAPTSLQDIPVRRMLNAIYGKGEISAFGPGHPSGRCAHIRTGRPIDSGQVAAPTSRRRVHPGRLIIGPAVFGVFSDIDLITRIGSFGVIVLLFMVWLEVAPSDIARNWKVAILGAALPIGLTTLVVVAIGYALNWPIGRSVLVGFVLALSSTAVVVKLFEERGERNSSTGQDVLSVLLVQGLAVIPMLIVIQQFSGYPTGSESLVLKVTGALVLIGVAVAALAKTGFTIPFLSTSPKITNCKFSLWFSCFGAVLFSGVMEISSALGAFVAGIGLRTFGELHWAEDRMHSFEVVLVALFFVSVGMLIDLSFPTSHWLVLIGLTLTVTVGNTLITAVTLRMMGRRWRTRVSLQPRAPKPGNLALSLRWWDLVQQ
jgi:CPA2 family monovalent cation:H+ antiporter-2